MAKQRIILVDDHEVVRLGLRSLLERHPSFSVVDEAGTAKEAVQKVLQHRPEVVGLGTYSREFAREIREAAQRYGVEPLITDDCLEVERRIAELQPELVLGTQMERHIAKRLRPSLEAIARARGARVRRP